MNSRKRRKRSLAFQPLVGCFAIFCLLLAGPTKQGESQPPSPSGWPAARELDQTLLARHNLRVLTGKHVTLVTDLPSSPEVDALPKVVDAAVPHLRERLGVAKSKTKNWRVQACVIKDKQRFHAARLLPPEDREFGYGLSLGYELWINDQATDYYRRHLLLHEATHSFMSTNLGSCGPGWYMEGMAELMGSHQWDPATSQIKLAVMHPDGPDARALGRVGLLQDAFAARKARSISSVFKTDNNRTLSNTSYAWVWALAHLLDAHPRYHDRFGQLSKQVLRPDFNDRVRRVYQHDWSNLQTEWRLMIATLQYGHDIEREAIEFKKGQPLESTTPLEIAADQGWQSTGILVEAGKRYRIKTEGRITLSVDPGGRPVQSEAGGITLDYHAGRPLGVLLAAIDARDAPAGKKTKATGVGSFLNPVTMGLARQFTPNRSGTLYLRINDSPARLRDNDGVLRVMLGK